MGNTKPGDASQLSYSDYLGLSSVLSSQKLKSVEAGKPAHDEMLFVIVHQAYELWFKQILHDLGSVIELFRTDCVDEKNVGIAVARMDRITKIQKLLLEQLTVLETMTALDFLDFRNYLVPASGFQSLQFRLIENRLGLPSQDRVRFEDVSYTAAFGNQDKKQMEKSENEYSLFHYVEQWLERTPFLQFENFDFLKSYRGAVKEMLEQDEKIIKNNPALSHLGHERQLQILESTKQTFAALFDKSLHSQLMASGQKRLSYEATLAALLIFLYRDQPILHLPFKFLTSLIEIDESLTTWRYRHALMVRRMIGTKIGTGGSSGHDYLKLTAERHKIFSDFFDLSTFLVPRSSIPPLPTSVIQELGFYYSDRSHSKPAITPFKDTESESRS